MENSTKTSDKYRLFTRKLLRDIFWKDNTVPFVTFLFPYQGPQGPQTPQLNMVSLFISAVASCSSARFVW